MVVLALALPCLLVAVRIEPFAHIALTWSTHWVAPPVGWTGLLGLLLAVLTTDQGGPTLAPVPMLSSGISGAGAVTVTRVEVTHIIALVTNIATLTGTLVTAPRLLTRGVAGTRLCGTGARVYIVTSGDHAMLQLGTQV